MVTVEIAPIKILHNNSHHHHHHNYDSVPVPPGKGGHDGQPGVGLSELMFDVIVLANVYLTCPSPWIEISGSTNTTTTTTTTATTTTTTTTNTNTTNTTNNKK